MEVFIDLRYICKQHFESIMIKFVPSETNEADIHDLRYLITLTVLKHVTSTHHHDFLVHPAIRAYIDRPEEMGTVLYDNMLLFLPGREELSDPRNQLVEGEDIFVRFEEEWELSAGSSDGETDILSDWEQSSYIFYSEPWLLRFHFS